MDGGTSKALPGGHGAALPVMVYKATMQGIMHYMV